MPTEMWFFLKRFMFVYIPEYRHLWRVRAKGLQGLQQSSTYLLTEGGSHDLDWNNYLNVLKPLGASAINKKKPSLRLK